MPDRTYSIKITVKTSLAIALLISIYGLVIGLLRNDNPIVLFSALNMCLAIIIVIMTGR